jgi:type I restriction enzyme S subunit
MVPYLRAANVRDGFLDLDDVKEMNFDPNEQRVFSLKAGDVLVTEGSGSLSAVGASAVWDGEIEGMVCFQNTLLRLRPLGATDPRFLAWWCRFAFADGVFASIATGANIFHVSAERVRGLPIAWFAPRQQRAIADFLDTETARIDALISKKRRLVELLDERFEADVRHLLAQIPGPRLPIKRRWQVVDCKHRTPRYTDTGYPVVSPGDTTPGRLDLSRAHRFVDETDLRDLTELPRQPKRGDIVYSRNASIGIASFVDTDEQFCMGQDVCLITSATEDQLYLMYALNSIGVDQLERDKIGSTFSRVNVAQIVEIVVPSPSPAEQTEIAAFFDGLVARRDETTSRLTQQIGLLMEHRRALITAAVTGELEIPGVAA